MRNISIDIDLSKNWTLSEINSEVSRWYRPILIILSVLLPVGYLGNSLVIFCNVKLYHQKKSAVRLLFLYLAFADLLSSIFLGPSFVYRSFFPLMNSTKILCQLKRFCLDFFYLTSLFTILVIAIERYNRICCVFNKQFSILMIAQILFGITVISCLLSMPRGIHETEMKFRIKDDIFAQVCWRSVKESPHFHYIVNFSLLVICGVMTITFYALVWFKLFKYCGKVNENMENIKEQKDIAHPRKFYFQSREAFLETNINILCIIVLFVFSYIPSLTLDMFFPLDHLPPYFGPDISREILSLNWLISHAFNPCVYGMCYGRCLLGCMKLFRLKNSENIEGEEYTVTSIL